MIWKAVMLAGVALGLALGAQAQEIQAQETQLQELGAQATSTPSEADIIAAPQSWRAVDADRLVIMQTSQGRIILELSPELAPRHVDHFVAYIRAGLYDNTPFHRVIKGFMAQGGDVEATYGAEKMLPPLAAEFTIRRDPKRFVIDTADLASEALVGLYKGMPIATQPGWLADMSKDGQVESWIPHCPGVLSSARTSDPNSANAQFFLISDEGRHLDRKYTAKGRTLAGLEVILAIKLGPTPDGYPIANPDVVISARMASDIPTDSRPRAYVERTDIPKWRAALTEAFKNRTDICDLPPVPAVIFD